MASEELSWVGTLGNSINVAEDALKLIIGMILGKFRYNLVSTSNIPFFNSCLIPHIIIVYLIILNSYFSVSSFPNS